MAKIRTFARIKPTDAPYDDFDCTRNRLYLRIPDSYSRDSTLYNRTRVPIVNHEFKYTQVFNTTTAQDEVYDSAARNIIDGFLEGYNGTIFAYGQTASGKTHTMHGDLNDPTNRGLAPRGLSQIFQAVSARKSAGESISMHVSFLEIYQEVGYDLLKPSPSAKPNTGAFSKVTVVDGQQGAAVVKNLSFHSVSSEEAAQGLLAQGELNRKVAETAMNNRSSRSHAVFTVYLSSRKGDLLVRSKMHFVDLAGSERVCKTGVKGLQLSEAKYINLSLHYLEGVIIALHQDSQAAGRANIYTAPAGVSKSWSAAASKRPYSAADVSGRPRHIPYRNSLLTMLLKDSLGGNCLTAMIATISLEMVNLSESISTCRFAQRVSCISNIARKNEEIDDKTMIKRLRTRVAELEAENSLLKHNPSSATQEEQESDAALTKEDKQLCKMVVEDFVQGKLMDPILAGVTDPFKFRECMTILKKLIKEHSDRALRLAEKLKQQPAHIQEAFYTGGRYHEAPLARPAQRMEVSFRDDSNKLVRKTYSSWTPKRQNTGLRPTILKSSSPQSSANTEDPLDAWQLQLQMNDGRPGRPSTKAVSKRQPNQPAKPQSAGVPLRRTQTPYERRKSQEVEQLNRKVEANLAQQIQEASHLKAFKLSVLEQELEVQEQAIRRRLEVAEHQLGDQHEYIRRLRQTSRDTDLVEQEELVGRQLHKRQQKLTAELVAVRAKLKAVREEESRSAPLPDENGLPANRTVKDKFSGYTRRDGSMDTNKVKTTLQQQQRLQSQLQQEIEQQRAAVIERQLEVKEQSTRQRLEEFKRRLAQSRQDTPATKVSPGKPPADGDVETKAVAVTSDLTDHGQTDSSGMGNKLRKESKLTSHQRAASKASTEHHKLVLKDNLYHQVQEGHGSNRHGDKSRSNHSPRGAVNHADQRSEDVRNIINKYRSGDPQYQAHARERTAKVDEILDKYRSTSHYLASQARPSLPGASRGAAAASNRLGHEQSQKAEPNTKQAEVRANVTQQRVVSVPKSAMAFQSRQLASSQVERRWVAKEEPRAKTADHNTANREDQHHSNFQATLSAMLKSKNGHTGKRTDAWSHHRAKDDGIAEKDLLRFKLKTFLTKQSKSKQRSESSKVDHSEHRQARNHPSASSGGTTPPPRPSSHRSSSAPRNYSHRIGHYQQAAQVWSNANESKPHHAPDSVSAASNRNTNSVERTDEISMSDKLHFKGLKKVSDRREHTNKVRQAQNAAIRIQRAWKQYRNRN